MVMSEEDQDPPRKRRVRGAHRASVTRLLSQLEEAIETGDARRLKQLKQSLTDKSNVLAKLDDELIELVEEEQLEAEVEQADLIKEKISLAIISIEDTLDALTRETGHARRDARRRVESSSLRSSESAGEEEHPAMSRSSSSTSDSRVSTAPLMDSSHITAPHSSSAPMIGATSSTTPSLVADPPLVSFPSVSPLLGALPHSTVTPTLTVSTLPSLPSTTFSGSLSFSAAGPGTFPSPIVSSLPLSSAPGMPPFSGVAFPHTSLPTMMPHPPSTHVIVPQVKLPKLSIRKFNGDLTRWVTFWDSFSSSIHTKPTLSSVDKFNYLISLLDSAAAEAIAGLTITSANYDEAIATLKKRFGNPQLIVNRHMEALLSTAAVSSHLDIKGLRKLYDTVEAHVRGLRALGVPAESYGGLLTSVLVNKLPPEIRLIVSREMTAGRWDLDGVMKILEREVDARERASSTGTPATPRRVQPRTPTAAALMASNSGPASGSFSCVYCGQSHTSSSCTVITDVTARKDILRKAGRCYLCLRRHHLSKNCHSNFSCRKCRGRHHVSICPRQNPEYRITAPAASGQGPSNDTPPSQGSTPRSTNAMYIGAQTPVLLQTARLQLFNPSLGMPCIVARAIMDGGSQRTYITCHLRDQLNLPTMGSESLQIKTFGTTETHDASCDVVRLGLKTKEGGTLSVTALVVPFICNPLISQPINYAKESYNHLLGLELADSADVSDVLEIDMLIGSDAYWNRTCY